MSREVNGKVLNVGSGRALSVNELTEAMMQAAGVRFEPVFDEADNTAGSCRIANTGHAESLLGISSPMVPSRRRPSVHLGVDPRPTPVSSVELSVIAPCYNEARNLPDLVARLERPSTKRKSTASRVRRRWQP